MREITLRQVEVIRAVMLRGTISGAAEQLNVSAPGISRLVKHTEDTLGIRLFERRAGRFVPSVEARGVFEQISNVYKGVENLQIAIDSLEKGENVRLSFASAPSVAQFVAPRAIRTLRSRYPDLDIDLDILKIEETVDYLLLERGEFVVMSSAVDNAGIQNEKLAEGRLVVVMPEGHALAALAEISVHDLVAHPLIGVDPGDPYGARLAAPFRAEGIEPVHSIRGRFAQTVVSLVRHGLGVALIDAFSVSEARMPGLVRRPFAGEGGVAVHAAFKRNRTLTGFAEAAIQHLRRELVTAAQGTFDPR